MRIGLLVFGVFAAILLAAADFSDTLPPALNDPKINYFRPGNDRVAKLDAKLADGSMKLQYASRAGYLKSVLDALEIPVESQLLVQSKTSLQADLISPTNPRSIFFNDSVAVAWMNGGFIEVAAQDPENGVIFYTLLQDRDQAPRFQRAGGQCLRCHQSDTSNGTPGMIIRSIPPGPNGEPMMIYGGVFTDHRTPIDQRWGGWYVTGSPAGLRHMGNARVLDRDKPEIVNSLPVTSLQGRFPVEKYLTPYSDAAALMVFDHQMYAMGLITRLSWAARTGATSIEDGARELVDYLVFTGEAPFDAKIGGAAGFAAKFSALGPRDSKGRSLRQLNLRTRTFEYPCSYMVYSDAFRALPVEVKGAVYRRMSEVLLAKGAGGQAAIEILRETLPEVREYFR
ncbi:MAG: hypothetical protein ABIR70_16235 [Bryobacteraceae bacterium]